MAGQIPVSVAGGGGGPFGGTTRGGREGPVGGLGWARDGRRRTLGAARRSRDALSCGDRALAGGRGCGRREREIRERRKERELERERSQQV